MISQYEEWVQIWYDTVQSQPGGDKIVAAYPKEHFMEDWKIGALQFLTGIMVLGAGTFAQKQDNRMADLWMFAINRYLMVSGMAVLRLPRFLPLRLFHPSCRPFRQ